MKVHKMFCIDMELAEKLKGENASALVNHLLLTHFEKGILANLSIEDLQKRLAVIQLKKKQQQELETLNNGIK